MKTQQLIEDTILASLGLLDKAETAEYERAFAAAPQSVQDLVREEQLRMADLGELLPGVEPREELRELVLAAVRAAMATPETAGVAGHIDRAPQGRPTSPWITVTPRVHRFWRAASIGLAAATVVLAVAMVNLQNTYRLIDSQVLIKALYDDIGRNYLESTLFDRDTRRVAMVSDSPTFRGVASVWHNPDWKSARLFFNNLRSDSKEEFRLVVLDADGNIVREVARFVGDGNLDNVEIKIDLVQDRHFAIYSNVPGGSDFDQLLLEGELTEL